MWALFISLIFTKTLLVPQILKKHLPHTFPSNVYRTPPAHLHPAFLLNEKHSIYSSSLHRVIAVLLLLLPVLTVPHILCALFRRVRRFSSRKGKEILTPPSPGGPGGPGGPGRPGFPGVPGSPSLPRGPALPWIRSLRWTQQNASADSM